MLKLNKPLFVVILSALIFLSGCNGEETAVKDVTTPNNNKSVVYESKGQRVLSPVEINYVVENPMEIKMIDLSEANQHHRSYIEVKGLVDNSVEELINKEIKELYDQLLLFLTGEKIPPFRGARYLFQPESKLMDSSLVISQSFNCNNVLSVVANLHGSYSHPRDGHQFFSMTETLNFDLNTGEKFLIEDLFTNDVKGLERLNEAIVEEVNQRRRYSHIDYEEHGDLNLIAPFKGISSEQKFFISDYGMNIVIDYNNPEFNVGFLSTYVTVPFFSEKEDVAITERFYNRDQSIFVKDIKKKRFLQNHSFNRIQKMDHIAEDDLSWNINISYPNDLPLSLQEVIDKMREEETDKIRLALEETSWLYVGQNIHAYPIGNLFNISQHTYFSGNGKDQWEDSGYVYLKTGERIELKELFIEGFDYETLIKKAIAKAKSQYTSKEFDTDFLFEGIEFRIDNSAISFFTKPYQWNDSNNYPMHFDLPFEKIGFENLKIFDLK
ncbi:hypothetical protein [Alkaliphilus transvaalensis]|uniref:hypothetical protein n=1 Tax=Alkaliphilus transvaalensis TaxID=114628 RepID=UPI00047DE410|nr:hypothetical protein [Alkaliphilus transvaalensis]